MITRICDYPDLIKLMGQLPVEFCITNESQRTLLGEGLASIVVKPAFPGSVLMVLELFAEILSGCSLTFLAVDLYQSADDSFLKI